mmetsp:Transcript_34599/g.104368  ORF Transcript_34599/g.104368 Transcript_34599/m.104368 type:complete len:237 (-) Transcript_34599:29-739(-)
MWALMFSRPVDVAAIDDVAKSQLQQAYVRLTKDARVTGEIAPLPAPDRAALVASFRETDSSLGSRTQKAVSNALTQIGWDHLDEHYDAESGLSLDMAQLERKTAVEFDGPVHYFANEPWMLTGRSKLKRRLLDLVGWDVVYVDYRDWDAATNKLDCIFDAFRKHGVDPRVARADDFLLKPLPAGESSEEFAALQRYAAARLAPSFAPGGGGESECGPGGFFLDFGPSCGEAAHGGG